MCMPLSPCVFLMCYCVSTSSNTIATVEQFHQTGRCMVLIVPFIQMLFTLSPWILHMFLQITQLDVIVKVSVFRKNGKVCLFGLFTVSLVVADSLDLCFSFLLFFLLFGRKWITSTHWSSVVSFYISFVIMGLIEGLTDALNLKFEWESIMEYPQISRDASVHVIYLNYPSFSWLFY